MTRSVNGLPRRVPVDGELTKQVHNAVLRRLADETGRDRLDPADQRQLVRAWIQDELDAEVRRRITHREPQLDPDVEWTVIRAVENTVWGLGHIQALLDVAGVEDIHITGCDVPLLRMTDGSIRPAMNRSRTPTPISCGSCSTSLPTMGALNGRSPPPSRA
jgi:pilus assembly protein CpaF